MSEDEKSAERAADKIASKMADDLLPPKPQPKTYSGGYSTRSGGYDRDYYDRGSGWDDHYFDRGHGSQSLRRPKPRREAQTGLPFDDDLSVMGGDWKPKGGGKVLDRIQARSEPELPYWIRFNVGRIKSAVEVGGAGSRPFTQREVDELLARLMMAFGDLLEHSGGLIWMSSARDAIKKALKDNFGGLCLSKGGSTVKLQTGEIESPPEFTGPLAEQAFIGVMGMVGQSESDAVAILDLLKEQGVRLMTDEDKIQRTRQLDEVEERLIEELREQVADLRTQVAELESENVYLQREAAGKFDDGGDLGWDERGPSSSVGWRPGPESVSEPEPEPARPSLPSVGVGVARSAIGRTMEQEAAARAVKPEPEPAAPVKEASIFDAASDDEDDEGFFAAPVNR